MYANRGLGVVGDAYDSLRSTLEREGPARAYLRDRWAAFLGLGPRIVDLQHAAALEAGRCRARGDLECEAQAKELIRELGRLNVKHGELIDRYELERVGEALGLAGWSYNGLGAVPFVPAAVFSALALGVLWAFRSFELAERKLELIQAGVLTPEQAAALDPGPTPGSFLEGLEGLGKLAVVGLLAWLAVQALTAYNAGRRVRRNPPLEVWHANPPETMSHRVYDVRYRHADDGLDYIHEFGPDVELETLDDGAVRLSHARGLPLWADFEVTE